jgi:para-nitrobenzyl esterase
MPAMTDDAATVQISSGQVQGVTRDGVTAFLGIPYAAPAVGAARFELPRAPEQWDGIRAATEHGPTALQSDYPEPIGSILPSSVSPGDDYLNVDIWTPDTRAAGLPVMVWIHGGAFVRGANSVQTYDGTAFARDGVVLVGINYRLGIAGFAVLDGAPTNLGIRDQIAALEWVRDNIAAFGGDPGNVTIFGESAGGMSVATLLASPAAQGLFHKAIMQSGNGVIAATQDDARKVSAAIAGKLGVEPTAKAFAAVDPAQLQAAQDAVGLEVAGNPDPGTWGASIIRGGLGVMTLFPVLDDDIVPARPLDGVTAGSGSAVPFLAGTTTEEFRLFTIPTGVAAMITAEAVPFVLARYDWDQSACDTYAANRPDETPGEIVTAMLTDLSFRAPTVALARAHTAAGGTTYLYEFAWRSPAADLGAAHALELPFVFDTLATARALTGRDAPQGLADETHAAWVRFAKTGEPGWAAYTETAPTVRVLDVESSTVEGPRADELACWLP